MRCLPSILKIADGVLSWAADGWMLGAGQSMWVFDGIKIRYSLIERYESTRWKKPIEYLASAGVHAIELALDENRNILTRKSSDKC